MGEHWGCAELESGGHPNVDSTIIICISPVLMITCCFLNSSQGLLYMKLRVISKLMAGWVAGISIAVTEVKSVVNVLWQEEIVILRRKLILYQE